MGDDLGIVHEGYVDFYDVNSDRVIISPKDAISIYIKHNIDLKSKGIVFIFVSDELSDRFVYPLNNTVIYNGEDKIRIDLYNYGKRSLVIEDKDVICNLILNELEETKND